MKIKMEESPKQLNKIIIASEISDNLSPEELAEYQKLKTKIMEVLTQAGVWSEEFSIWMDKNLRSFGMLGKGTEAFGMWKGRRKTEQNLAHVSHYRKIIEQITKRPESFCPKAFAAWIDSASPELLEEIGELMDYASFTYINYTTRKDLKKINKNENKTALSEQRERGGRLFPRPRIRGY